MTFETESLSNHIMLIRIFEARREKTTHQARNHLSIRVDQISVELSDLYEDSVKYTESSLFCCEHRSA